jgi:signal transduction histidine kinase
MKVENCGCRNHPGIPVSDDEIRTEFAHVIEEVRRVSYDLAPEGLHDFDLDIAFRTLCNGFNNNNGIGVDDSSYGNFSHIPMKVKSYLYRMAAGSPQ